MTVAHISFASVRLRKTEAFSRSSPISHKARSRPNRGVRDGFGYDPVFFFEELRRTYAEITREEKNQYSHRGKAFRKILAFLKGMSL